MPSFANLLRARDLLDAQFEFVNLTLDAADAGRPRLRRISSAPAAIVLRLAPQHVAEEAASESEPLRFPCKAFLSAPSRLVFTLANDVADIAFTAEAILTLLSGKELTHDGLSSVVEFPDRLLLVPAPGTHFFHVIRPATSTTTRNTAIWHGRIATSPDNRGSRFRAVPNALDTADRLARTALKQRHRKDIVTLSTTGGDPHIIASSRFMLTALGASASLKSDWPADATDLLQAWDHDTESARDLYVRTAEQGYLFPFGHRATLVTTTKREFGSHFPLTVAELAQEQLLLIQEGERNYRDLEQAYPSAGREMPLKRVTIATPAQPIASDSGPLQLKAMAVDIGGNLVACDLTAFFVPAGAVSNDQKLKELREAFNSHSSLELANQPVAIAEDPGRRGDGKLNVAVLRLGVLIGDELRQPLHPPFLPFMKGADVRMPALAQLLGTAQPPSAPGPAPGGPAIGGLGTTAISLHDRYLRDGFLPGDKKQVFAQFAAIPGISIPAEKAGGLAAPRFPEIDGLSQTLGPVSGASTFASGDNLTPDKLIGDTKILGMIPLKDVITAVIDEAANNFPENELQTLYDKIDLPTARGIFVSRPMMTTITRDGGVETRFLWKPKLKQDDLPPLLMRRSPDTDIEFVLKGRITKSLASAAAPGFEVEGKLTNFNLKFADLLTLKFNGIGFKSSGGRKPEMKVDFSSFEFGTALKFVTEIQKLIPLKGLGDAPPIEPRPDGIFVRYAIPLPSLPLGIFSIQNIALSSSVSIPFVEGKPLAVRFALSERSDPFIVSMSIFGGTGFFAVEVRTDGSVLLEAAIEFGGIVALDLVIAKGSIYLLAGIFVSIETGKGVVISGYLRFGGCVEVLEIVAVSIEFMIALTYDSHRDVLFGEGRVTVAVRLLFFSESFSFKVTKEVPGFGQAPDQESPPPAGPTIMALSSVDSDISFLSTAPMATAAARRQQGTTMNADQWRKYCAAFE